MKTLRYALLFIFATLALTATSTNAQQTYVQPMLPISWPSKTIYVNIPEKPTWANQAFQQAMTDWNEAQTWFLASYEPNHQSAKYTLLLAQTDTNPGNTVQVQYVPPGSYNGIKWVAITSVGGKRIWISNQITDPNLFKVAAEHELGHVLGIADNCVSEDLESNYLNCKQPYVPYQVREYPSTLNLYAVYVQAVSGDSYGLEDSVTLPTQIPYSAWSPSSTPIPEFSSGEVLMLIAPFVGLCAFSRRKYRVTKQEDYQNESDQ